jgi:type VI secretion system protein ImpG
MSAELLPFYNRELSYIRKLADSFAQEHPKIAGRLRLGPEGSSDPHVERLIEAFAYLTARVRHKIDDEFPEITQALLGVLYPHYQAPIPSMAIVQFELDPEQNEASAYVVPRHAGVESEPIQGERCHFRTAYPVSLWPITLKQAAITRPPFSGPAAPHAAHAASMLRISLASRDSEIPFGDMPMESLRFYLKGQAQHIFGLYEFLLNNVIEVAIARTPNDPAPLILRPDCIRPVGFERADGMLPYPARSFLGYRLLTEFFVFPEKFLFVDVNFGGAGSGDPRQALAGFGSQLELFIYLNQANSDLEHNVTADTFRLGCSPMVNLYAQRAEPIAVTPREYEYRVIPDIRRPTAHEVYSVDHVTASGADHKSVEFVPLFSTRHSLGDHLPLSFWHAIRRPSESVDGQPANPGTEVFVSLVDLDLMPSSLEDMTLDVQTTCLNRDLPAKLPFGGNQPRLQLGEGGGPVSRILCLTAPTRTYRPASRQGLLWRLISHLSLNHLSLVSEGDKAESLREILRLYDFSDSPQTRRMIDGISDIRSRRVVGWVAGEGQGAYCRGVEVTVEFDETRFSGGGLFLFATVLEHFLALYCTMNSFTKMVARTKGGQGDLRKWPPRMGERVLV